MSLSLAPSHGSQFQPKSQPLFSGSGSDGDVRILVAKTLIAQDLIVGLKKQKGIQHEGSYPTADSFLKALIEKEPDVVVVGAIFGSGERTPLTVVQEYLEKTGKSAKDLGIVLWSCIDSDKAIKVSRIDETKMNINYVPLKPGEDFFKPALEAIQKADPTQ